MGWVRVAGVMQLAEADAIEVQALGRRMALFRVDGAYYATDALCTHAFTHLVEGYVEGDTVECPLHEGGFHIPTGKALGGIVNVDLGTYPVRVEGDAIGIEVSE